MPDGFTLSNRKWLDVSPPRTGIVQGAVGALVTSTTPSYIDLLNFPAPPAINVAVQGNGNETRFGVSGQNFSVQADTTDCLVVFGPTVASVTGTFAPTFTATGTVAAGIYTQNGTNAPGLRLPSTGVVIVRFNLKPNDRFMGFVATGAGVLRFYQSSDSSP